MEINYNFTVFNKGKKLMTQTIIILYTIQSLILNSYTIQFTWTTIL